jgi:hypothetical protein
MKRPRAVAGSVVLVPLAPGGFAVGVVIHTTGKGSCVGAFFGPRVRSASEVDTGGLRLENAVWVCKFGDYGIHNSLWPVIGAIPNWASAPWSVTRFARGHDDPSLCYVTEYDNLLNVKSDRVAPASEGQVLPENTSYGSGNVERRLAKLLP